MYKLPVIRPAAAKPRARKVEIITANELCISSVKMWKLKVKENMAQPTMQPITVYLRPGVYYRKLFYDISTLIIRHYYVYRQI